MQVHLVRYPAECVYTVKLRDNLHSYDTAVFVSTSKYSSKMFIFRKNIPFRSKKRFHFIFCAYSSTLASSSNALLLIIGAIIQHYNINTASQRP